MTDAATLAQIDAAHPKRSTWLSANAGSGKTRVLTDRVALLLLQGQRPERILCLTYTKAAASEMQNRLFKRLGAWAMMQDADLIQSLTALGVAPGEVNSKTLRDARRLFAKAIETPGGLKIQTIHSFCAALLRRFPVEAGVSPAFKEMDDRSAKQLRADVMDHIAAQNPDDARALATYFTGEDPDGLLQEILKHGEQFEPAATDQDLRSVFQLEQSTSPESIVSQVLLGNEDQLIAKILPVLDAGKPTDATLAGRLRQIDLSRPDLLTLAELEHAFLTKKEPFKPNAVPTKGTVKSLGPDAEALDQFKQRIADARQARLALLAYERSKALHSFASHFLRTVRHVKQQRGWLDFDDLIRRARDLLTKPDVADWVLFRLDGGIDHILVDEAQDTSPLQWDVIRLLARELTTGQTARNELQRTLFVVGDKKQSIYSFQGADPAKFDAMCAHFEEKFAAIQAPFARRELLYSFRSAKPILQLVDTLFTEELRRGMGDVLQHKAFKDTLPGRVDLWNWIDGTDAEDDKEWFDPVDTVGAQHHSVQLAHSIAAHIEHQLAHGQITQVLREDGVDHLVTRPLTPKDFLILVESRMGQGKLFHEIIRACKKRDLPMAGADRLRVGGELGVRDLVSLLSFLETPQDDLALAEIIRSPLGNLSEQDLYSLAYGRDGTLWSELDAQRATYAQLYEMLDDLRNQADFMRPFDLLERALTVHGARARLMARLGPEAEEGIVALLDQALQYELTEAPTLTGFLTWLKTDDVTIKREMDSDSDLIRVMTVHGAKGLEAPVVIIPQTGDKQNRIRDDILSANGIPIWKSKSDAATARQTELTNAQKDLQQQERMRLLYVALTRAESWLIICGSGKAKEKGETWYEMVEAGMSAAGALPGDGAVKLRLSHHDWPAETEKRTVKAVEMQSDLPDWIARDAPAPTPRPKVLSPSELGGAKVLTGPSDGLSEADAKRRGTTIHELIQFLSASPPQDHIHVAQRVLQWYPNLLEEDLHAHAQQVLTAKHLQFLFHPAALVEVPVTAALPELGGAEISGAIDRLLISESRVLAVDFKSNRLVPQHAEDTPEGILRQMGAYAAALSQIYPDRPVETAIVWTETAELMSLSHDIVRQALQRSHIS
ncbi:MAG: double-strand break repair helicase AddA [Pseudomonadota bacterium]